MKRHPNKDVAVVGMACRFPGANDYHHFWENLANGVNSIQEITTDRWDVRDYYSPDVEEPNKSVSKWGGLVDRIFDFDHQFFQISSREALHTDPQQRLLLEESYHCIEDSGIPLRHLQQKKTNVYVGIMTNDYIQELSHPHVTTDGYACLGTFEGMTANRISYAFNLQGMSIPLNAACASGLVAIHEAKRALLANDCDYAIAAGVNLNIHPLKYIAFSKARMLSPDGQCKTFDKSANGYVPGDGVAVLLLQRLDKAIAEQNRIYGVIKGAAVNHCGRGLSITAPRIEAQRKVILKAYQDAGFGADTVTYAEAHGTGTSLGDPIEIEALTQAFRTYTDDNRFCQIGSVKTNIGHTESVAGMAGVIKVLMMMRHKKVPKSLNIETLNPIIDFEATPFDVATELKDWASREEGQPLRASVSSFGFGGINSHVLLEEYQEPQAGNEPAPERDSFFILSAKNKTSLEKLIAEWRLLLDCQKLDVTRLGDISNTLLAGRESFPFRFGGLVRSPEQLKELLEAADAASIAKTALREQSLVLPEGGWNGYAGLETLYAECSVFKKHLDRQLKLLRALPASRSIVKGFHQAEWNDFFKALYSFVAGYAYAMALIDLGLSPKLVTGEKSGLYAALAVSGIAEVSELLLLLSGNMEPGQVTVKRPVIPFYDPATGQVFRPAEADERYVSLLLQGLEEITGPDSRKTVEHYVHKARLLYENQFTFKKYVNDWHDIVGKHSDIDLKGLLFDDGLLSDAERYKREIRLLLVVLVSSLRKLNQKWDLRDQELLDNPCFYELIDLLDDQAMPKELLAGLLNGDAAGIGQAAQALGQRVQFINLQKRYAVLKEHNQSMKDWLIFADWLETAVKAEAGFPAAYAEAYSQVKLSFHQDAGRSFKEALLGLWLDGGDIRWEEWVPSRSFRKMSLPLYPYKRETFRLTVSKEEVPAARINPPSTNPTTDPKRPYSYLTKQWELYPSSGLKEGNGVIAILATDETEALAACISSLLPGQVRVLSEEDLESDLGLPEYAWERYGGCIDLWGCGKEEPSSLVWISWLQKLIEFGKREEILLLGVTRGLESLSHQELPLSGSTRAGLYRMLQGEYRHIRSRHMDGDASLSDRALAEQIAAEFRGDSEDTEVIYREGARYRAYLKELDETAFGDGAHIAFSPGEVLLITGGTRGLGYLCARHFITRYGVRRLVLTGREVFPPQEEWDAYQGQASAMAEKIAAVRELERLGAEVRVLSLPLTDGAAVQAAIGEVKRSFGSIGGVIHCAGSLDRDTPAFIRKPLADIENTLGPKLMGIHHLYQGVKDEPLRFFVLFSSISAIIPSLSAGLSDYAMANAHLDYVAQAVPESCPMVSIQWPSWREAGMGEFKNAAYDQSGLLSITNAEGLYLLDRILAGKPARVVLPCVYNADSWSPAKLMQRTLKEAKANGIQWKQSAVPEVREMNRNELIEAAKAWLISLFSKEMNVAVSEFETDVPFQDYGMDSILLAQVVTRMDRELKTVAVDPSVLLENPTMDSLADHLTQSFPEALRQYLSVGEPGAAQKEARFALEQAAPALQAQCNQQQPLLQVQSQLPAMQPQYAASGSISRKQKIAVVGLACQFPDAPNARVYWSNLISRKDSIREVPLSRWDIRDHYHPNEYREGKSISKWGSFLPDIEQFDPDYFQVSESLAEQMDPLQRKFLEVGAEAVADAGYGKKDLWGRQVGVFVGSRVSNFQQKSGAYKKETIVGTGQNFVAAHMSHVFNFKGPNMVVDAACSSSLASVHLAVRSIQNGECEMALAGGVEILLDETMYLTLSAAHVLSSDGRCKTFSANANGIALGEGSGAVLLKPLEQAVRDGNKIYGVIDGSAVNNDGNTMGITTPNPEAQKELIEKAIADADIKPETISYMETHGTGTLIGDPIELKAITQVFSKHTTKRQFCGVGSVKSNMGHLLSAAGIASLIKVLLGISERKLPATLHCSEPNPRFQFRESPFYILQETQGWDGEDGILRAGVSAFGLGGNNAHVLVSNEGVPAGLQATVEAAQRSQLFNRRRIWPWPEQAEAPYNTSDAALVEDEFMIFFDSIEVDNGRDG